MALKVTLRLSSAAAAVVRKDAPKEEKLKAALGQLSLAAADLATLLYFLSHDADMEIRGTALKTLRGMPESVLFAILESADAHPKVLDLLARIHYAKPGVVSRLAFHPAIEGETLEFLAEKEVLEGVPFSPVPQPGSPPEPSPPLAEDVSETEGERPEDDKSESEEFLSKYQLLQQMGVGEKIKMALTGDKEWRSLLIKDSNKLVCGSVIKNPRITDAEILALTKGTVQNDEVMRLICTNKEWVKNSKIRVALVANNKTPLPYALKFMSSLSEKDLALLAKSKNVSSVIATQARRTLLNKKKS